MVLVLLVQFISRFTCEIHHKPLAFNTKKIVMSVVICVSVRVIE